MFIYLSLGRGLKIFPACAEEGLKFCRRSERGMKIPSNF